MDQCLCRFDLRQGTKLISIFYFTLAFAYVALTLFTSPRPDWTRYLYLVLALADVAFAFWLWYATEKRNVYWLKVWLLLDVFVLAAYWVVVLWGMAKLGLIQVWNMDVYEVISVLMVVIIFVGEFNRFTATVSFSCF